MRPLRRRSHRVRTPLALFAVALAAGAATAGPSQVSGSDAASLWSISDAGERLERAGQIAAVGSDFDTLHAGLAHGPTYSAAVPRGRVQEKHRIGAVDHPYLLLVPEDYDPVHRYPVRVYLHGGIGRSQQPGKDGTWWRNTTRLERHDSIAVFPASWSRSQWWHGSQLQNLRRILERLKRDYNIDENRVHMFGVSDGGTGAWYFAFRDPTPWAGFVAMIGHPAVLSSPSVGAQGQFHITNLINRRFLLFNGGVDRLYPVTSVEPFVRQFERAGVALEFVPKPDDGHTVRWWDDEAERIEGFLEQARRAPLPSEVAWETEDPAAAGRVHWLVIDELGFESGEESMDSNNLIPVPGRADQFGMAFKHDLPSGRIDAAAEGNTISVRTRGIRRFRLLVSPDQFDLSVPLRVVVNGNEQVNRIVEPDPDVLLRWAARDLDRTMLFGAEIEVTVAR